MTQSSAPVSLIVQRSSSTRTGRVTVRVGRIDAGYRDLHTGTVHCDDARYLKIVTDATAPLAARRNEPAHRSPTADLHRATLAATSA
jgi:deoxycytidine triphosphate deaminase